MRSDTFRTQIRLTTLIICLAFAIGTCSGANAQIIPTPGFPYDTYNISADGALHFCRLTDTELTYAKTTSGTTRLLTRNYASGVESTFDQVNALLAAQTTRSASDVHVSPDGQWAAWPTSKGGKGGNKDGVSVASLTGKHYRFIDAPATSVISWAPEPNMVICFSSAGAEYTRLGYFNIDTGELDSDFHIARHSGLAGLDDGHGRRFLVCFCPLTNHKAWSVTVPPAFKTGSTRFGLGGACVFEMYELSNTALAKTGYAIDLPQKCDLIQAVVSPHHRYVIWQVGFEFTTELWISDMNGVRMRRALTMIDKKNAAYTDAEPPIADVMWLPVGAKLGCRVGGTLYIVHLDIDKDQAEP